MSPVRRRRGMPYCSSSIAPIVSGSNRPSGLSKTGLSSSPAFKHVNRMDFHQRLEPLGERRLAAADRAEQIENLFALFETLRGVPEESRRSARSSLPCRRSQRRPDRPGCVRFIKIRPRRGSLAVSTIWGSPIAASKRSAALAYRIGSPRHDSRYSAIDISTSDRASKLRANVLNRESLYMWLPLCTAPWLKSRRCCIGALGIRIANQHSLASIGHFGLPNLQSGISRSQFIKRHLPRQFAEKLG